MRNSHHLFLCVRIFVLAGFSVVHTQTIEDEFRNPCTPAGTCSDCIQTSPVCAWCAAEVYSREYSRCDKLNNLLRNCANDKIVNPTSNFKIIRNQPFTSGGASEPPVQVKPQKIEFSLRPNEPTSFKLQFQQQANYPVDLYFLLDLSYGMHRQVEAQERLIALGNDIPDSMASITNNFRLGFGTFVDKSLMPYIAWTDKMLKDRCPIKNGMCREPHDFKNELSIGSNQSSFALHMKTALETVSQSLDDAEGGLDGLIQALDCEVIGWREVSRRIIVYSSNSLFHLAGAGKLGGATRQNRMKCNLSAEGNYLGDKIYDYPSVSQIAQKLRDNKANVIFAVMDNVAPAYRALETFLDGAVVGELADDSRNIVGLIKEKYYQLRSRIEFRPFKSTNVDVKIKSKCKGSVMKEVSFCENLEIMDSVEFDVALTVNRDICKGKLGTLKKQFFLNAVGLNDAVVVNLNVLCNCECEMSSHKDTTTNSGECTSGNGILECGICSCNPGRFGRVCECDETEISEEKSLEFCKADRNDTTTCSGNGECICGVCECLPVNESPGQAFTGPYCGCNNYNCLRGKNKLLCGGPSRGKCNCGTCDCLPGWSGNSCECPTDETPCMATNGELCNGVGTCQCGRCDCNTTFSGIVGPTCEDCLTCPSQCNEYLDCAHCKGFQSGSYYDPEQCEQNCKDYTIHKRESLPSGEGIRSCEGKDKDSCTFYFTYEYSSVNDVILTIQQTKECDKKVPLAPIIGGTVAAVVLIPLLLICLFIFLRNLKDKEEYSKFLRDREKAKWDSGANPIYREPTTTFHNLNYRADEDDATQTVKLGIDKQ